MLDGQVYSAWSGNLNGGRNGELFLDVRVARATIPAGPRGLDGTSGVVTAIDASGTPEARSFAVTFDRPIDPSTFSTDDVAIRYLSPNGTFAENISANNIVQLSATQFRIEFPSRTSPGTYSYAIGPNVRDLIRTVDAAGTIVRTGNLMDQDANAVPDAGQGGISASRCRGRSPAPMR